MQTHILRQPSVRKELNLEMTHRFQCKYGLALANISAQRHSGGFFRAVATVFWGLVRRSLASWLTMSKRNSRIGLVLFVVYLSLYGGFVFLNAFDAETMELTPLGGVNLAILYGFGLIVSAVVLAVIYGVVCSISPAASEAEDRR